MKKTLRVAMLGSCFALLSGGLGAQDLRDVARPAEVPPASFSGSQYVDSRGCVFIRAGMSGNVNWVPRVRRNRTVLCGFEPSLQAASAPAVQAPAPRPVAAAPAVPGPPAPASASPALPSATVQAAPARSPLIREAAAPRRVSLTELCAGRSGVLQGYTNANTGQPIDCGPAAAMPPAAPAAIAPLRRERVGGGAHQCLASMVNGTSAQIDGMRCGPQAEQVSPRQNVAAGPGPVAPARSVMQPPLPAPSLPVPSLPAPSSTLPAASPWACLEAISRGQTFVQGPQGAQIRCAPQSQSPSGGGAWRSSGATGALVPSRDGEIVPAVPSAGGRQRGVAGVPPSGYLPVWSDGRLNPHRGVTVLRSSG